MADVPKVKRVPVVGLLLMSILSFGNIAGLNISNVVIPLGVVLFFINKVAAKETDEESGLDLTRVARQLKDKRVWVWVLLPLLVNIVNVTISRNFLPQYIEYETARAGAFIVIEISVISALLFFVFALGEEIAWRAFFQRHLSRRMNLTAAILISSLLFTLGHFQPGNPSLVLYGLLFTFINSCLYGIVFYKTRNAWISALSHFLANMFEVLLYVL